MADSLGLIITTLGTLTGIALSLTSTKFKRVGMGIAGGSLIVGLPLTFMSSEARTESVTSLSDITGKAEQKLKEVGDTLGIDTDLSGIIPTD